MEHGAFMELPKFVALIIRFLHQDLLEYVPSFFSFICKYFLYMNSCSRLLLCSLKLHSFHVLEASSQKKPPKPK